jgi:ribonucleoside-diphosphate reductase alpha chain
LDERWSGEQPALRVRMQAAAAGRFVGRGWGMLSDRSRAEARSKKNNGANNGNAKPSTREIPAAARVRVERRYTRPGVSPYDEIEWELRKASISGEDGKSVFEQKDVEVPKFWSQMATNVVVSKYFRGALNTPQREKSVRQLIGRVADTITRWGRERGYFAKPGGAGVDEDRLATFNAELTYVLLHQHVAFNSPVWFNVGVEKEPQCSACFINSVGDSMSSILDLAKTEGMLFKYGSGTGTNFSALRSSREMLAGGGTASGPVSFMKGFDSFAGVIKSGGKTRRAAKMVILNIDHPDISDFIRSKADEERKAWALIDAGYEGAFNVPGGAYDSVQFQNANHSVRVTDDFMRSVVEDKEYKTRRVTDGEPAGTYRARDLWKEIAQAAWLCGDPGVQYDTTVNEWHTCPNTARINASNPCSEYMFLDDSACNLASLNLMKHRRADGSFDVDKFRHDVEITFLAMEIIVGASRYPTAAIAQNSFDYRPLGLGYANLGAYLMSNGIAYDSPEARAFCGAVTALMTGHAYTTSSRIAAQMGTFAGYPRNREPFLRVMKKHRAAVSKIDKSLVGGELVSSAQAAWDAAVELGDVWGYRNSQATVIAPTGTIAFLMDCDTTGIEPDIALVKYKKLVGGGTLKIVNQTVPNALKRIGYDDPQVKEIVEYIDANGTIEGAPSLKNEHLPVFDCAFKPANGNRSIHYLGHIRMMAAAQPFISGAISKTVNMPNNATAEEIASTYQQAWELGLKAVAIYRDGCKRTQPLSTSSDKDKKALKAVGVEPARAERRPLPDERASITHKFSVSGHDGYITVGMYEDGTPGEIFLVMAKEGSTVSGLMDSFATSISLALQYGVPLRVLVDKFSHTRFEPSGFTNNPRIPLAKSISDYIFRWLADKFVKSEDEKVALGVHVENAAPATVALPAGKPLDAATREQPSLPLPGVNSEEKRVFQAQADAPSCPECGEIMVRNAACYKCLNCGTTSGCS